MSLSQLTLFAEDSHASPFPQPGSEEARKTTVISGQRCYELSGLSDRIGLLAKTLLESSVWHSMMCFLTWRTKATPANRLLFQLVPSMLRIEGIESGLLATPNTMDSLPPKSVQAVQHEIEMRPGRKKFANLRDQLAHGLYLPISMTQEVEHPEMEVTENGRRKTKGKRDSHSMNLADTMRLLPTPATRDYKGANGKEHMKKARPHMDQLPNVIVHGLNRGYKLQPAFVEWMMGYPLGWSDIELND